MTGPVEEEISKLVWRQVSKPGSLPESHVLERLFLGGRSHLAHVYSLSGESWFASLRVADKRQVLGPLASRSLAENEEAIGEKR